MSYFSLKFYPLFSDYPITSSYWWKEKLNPKTYYRSIKYFCQRGYRGYARCDYWSADAYLETVMLGVLKDLKKHKHGYPANLSDRGEEYSDNYNPDLPDNGSEKWDAILDEIIDGLEASQDLKSENSIPTDLVYPHHNEPFEFVPCPDNPDCSMIKETEDGSPRFVVEEYDKWAEPLKKKRKRAAHLLVKHWDSLWD